MIQYISGKLKLNLRVGVYEFTPTQLENLYQKANIKYNELVIPKKITIQDFYGEISTFDKAQTYLNWKP